MTEPMQNKSPKVFLSHATEDKERFVLDFARRLREAGVDVWLDFWELYPGDSLIDKIFEEGLKNADAVVIVISNISVTKNWVREELNAAAISRINKGCMLIPVVIDDCEIPEPLKSLVWLRIPNLVDYTSEFERIVATIFKKRDRPPLGQPPGYASSALPEITDLSHTDVLILKGVGDIILRDGDGNCVLTEDLWKYAQSLDLPRQELEDSLLVLSEMRFLEKGREVAPFPTYFSSTVAGFEMYARFFVPEYKSTKRAVSLAIINGKLNDNDHISEELGQPLFMITHIFDDLAAKRLIGVAHAAGGHAWVTEVSPRLRRSLEDDNSW